MLLHHLLRLKGTVILKIWKQMIFIILYTATIVALQSHIPVLKINFPQTLIPVLGVVTGLLLVFRTNTAYDRYWEGRKLWSTMTQHIRTVTRLIWVGVKEPSVREVIEKKTAINILLAFAYATKNYLREEYNYDDEEIHDLIKHLPQFAHQPPNTKSFESQIVIEKKISAPSARSKSVIRKESVKPAEFNYIAHDLVTPTNIPVELSYYIASYIEYLRQKELCDGSLLWTMTSAVGNMMDCLVGFERISRTPIPLAYSVHLHHAVWLYLLALPYQLVGPLHYWTIAAVALASFSLIGILEIGWEIENPFGYDDNDLPLDDFCKVLKQEIQLITSNGLPSVESWMWSSENQPLAPKCSLTANELSEKSLEEVRQMLIKHDMANQESTKDNLKKTSSLMSLFRNVGRNSPEV